MNVPFLSTGLATSLAVALLLAPAPASGGASNGASNGTQRAPAAAPIAQAAGHFAVPDGPLVIADGPSGDMMLVDLLQEFRRVTGQNIVMSDATRELALNTRVGLLGGVTIAPSEVYSFVEGLLHRHGFAVAELRHADPPLLGVYHPDRGDTIRSGWIEVDVDDIHRYADHKALLVQTMLDVSPLSARQASTTLRTVMRDTSRQNVVAISDTSLLVAGTGSDVAAMTSMLRKAAANEQAFLDAQPRPDPGAQTQGR